jgi:hypothetical protein
VCIGGNCQGGCEGVNCPSGQVCEQGFCLDLCQGVTCSGSQVCENGICIPSCECRGCATGEVCAASHHCVEAGCEKQTCNPPATVCVSGSCQDNCEGVHCPAGQACQAGTCVRTAPVGTGGFMGVIVDAGASGSGGGPTFDAGRGPGTGGVSGGINGSGGASATPGAISTCSCNLLFGAGAEGPLALGVLVALVGCLRRRRA